MPKLRNMVVRLSPETESRLQELAATTGRAPEEIVEDAMTGYLAELTPVRGMLDRRYDEMKTGQIRPIDGKEAFRSYAKKPDPALVHPMLAIRHAPLPLS